MFEDKTSAAQLMAQIAKGDRQAFEALYDEHADMIYSFLRRMLKHEAEAEEICQEVFLQIWLKAEQFDASQGSLCGWILSLARYRTVDHLRRVKRQAEIMDELFVTECNGAESGSNGQLHASSRDMLRSLRQLPLDQRRAIELTFFSGMSQAEAAKELDAPIGTIKARIRRGLSKLRTQLNGDHDK